MTSTLLSFSQAVINKGFHNNTTFQEQKKIRILNRMTINGSIILFVFAMFNLFLKFHQLVIINLAFSFSTLIVYSLSAFSKHNIARFIAFICFPIHLLSFSFYVGSVGAEYYIILLLIMAFYIIDHKKTMIFLTIYLILTFILAKYFLFTRSFPEEYQIIESSFYFSNLTLFVILIVMASFVFKYDTLKYQVVIEEQAQSLSSKVDELENQKLILEKLLRELNHRVKNNLQMVSGLFTMQMYTYKNDEIQQALSDARQRIDSIAILYQHLYRQEKDIRPNIKTYINELVDYVVQASGFEDIIELKQDIDDYNLSIEFAIHIGLIANELLTNSLKYGIDKNLRNNQIRLNIYTEKEKLHISVSDSGKGFPDDFNLEQCNSFGLELVENIAQKYQGKLQINNTKGAEVLVQLNISES